MKIIKIFLMIVLVCFPLLSGASDYTMSDVFADVYEKLDGVNWAGKNINVAIESLENLNPNARITSTGNRIALVWDDELIASYPYPEGKDWKSYGDITTAFLLQMRERDSRLQSLNNTELYQVVVNTLLSGINQNGEYMVSRDDFGYGDNRMLTSIGFDGERDERGNFRISGVFKDSPADNAGVKDGDIVSEINGQRVANMQDNDISSVLAGYNSGTVKLKLLTPFGNRKVTLRRASVVSADADIIYRGKNEKETGILEIVVHKVSDGAVNIINEALSAYSDINGIILDLRTSNGEDEKAAAKMAGLFIGQKPVMRIVESGNDEVEIVPGGDAVTDAPVVVLISDTTRGTAEAIAASFYENERGVLIGTPTAGSAKMASFIDLKNGGVLELFNKSIKTGNGRSLDGRGIFPLVCLSNIRNTRQSNAFFLNVLNGDFNVHDYNRYKKLNAKALRKACPNIVSGKDEDNIAGTVSVKILTNKKIYKEIMDL